MAILAKIMSKIVMLGILTQISSAQATLIEFKFEGPIDSSNTNEILTGSVTFDPTTIPTDITNEGDNGDRNLYLGAITNLSFTNGSLTKSFSTGNIEVWNDYEMCIIRRANQCTQTQSETERLLFRVDSQDYYLALIILGFEHNHELLSSGQLPNKPPKEENIFRVDFFYQQADDSVSIASNAINLLPNSVSAPNTFTPLMFTALIGWRLIFRRKASIQRSLFDKFTGSFTSIPR